MAAHTPKPWIVWEPETEHGTGGEPAKTIVIGKEKKDDVTQEIAYVNCQSFYFDSEDRVDVPSELIVPERWPTAPSEAMANAHLISRAPSLLALLEDILSAAEVGNERFKCGPDEAIYQDDWFTKRLVDRMRNEVLRAKGKPTRRW